MVQAPARVVGARKSCILNRMQLANFQSSTKIEALREELALMLQRDPSAKAIVFSQVHPRTNPLCSIPCSRRQPTLIRVIFMKTPDSGKLCLVGFGLHH